MRKPRLEGSLYDKFQPVSRSESTGMNIRDAVVADLPTIVSIYNSTIASRMVTADVEPVAVESRLSWFHAHTPDCRPLWVLEIDQEIAGWLGFQSFYSSRAAYHTTAELSIYIAANYRRQGVGRQLLEHAIDRSPSLELKTLIGVIFAHNHPSLQLFEQFGFTQWGYLPQVAEFAEIGMCDVVILGRKV
ncbi:N-acetyltransferase family protein [Pantanalinema sp. GBBB05]|uniref:GNAT family N-acetyltransferase n=1 Tax=Pantanalinema sp. GBBB05 TaxID=2604139 RepID=UPI003D8147DA